MSFPNVYAHRKVAETSAKSCDICFKPSTSVLITTDSKDFFYICPSHLKDAGFCTPKIDQAAVEARRKKELDDEVARVKKEYEEKQRKKKEEKEKKDKEKKDKDKDKSKKDKDKKEEDDKKDKPEEKEAEKLTAAAAAEVAEEEEPRLFELKSAFYQQRLGRKRQIEMAKRNRERLQDPTFFPSVPKNLP
ncbi:VPS4-associated protein 1 [Schizothecium vesticola]|uniref:VPS4-associated protein 1 n=1 Tax=Schizothecium vesticola TaxID=314040 RepID=A0AA40BPB3_9PEZI|nr:VPS4-associated protein 1 [Schizothecium vesticola]